MVAGTVACATTRGWFHHESFCCQQMATLDKAQQLLADLRGASYDAAVKDHEELEKFVKERVRQLAF